MKKQDRSSTEQPKAQDSSAKKAQLGADADPNEANRKGGVETGARGTQATASQQQGQGLKSAKDHNSRSGSESGGGNTNKKER